MRRLTCQRGQAAIDYLAVLAAAGAIVALLVIAAPSFAERIVCAVQNQLAKLGIVEPCSAGQAAREQEPLCVVSDSSGKVKVELTVFSVQGGGEIEILRQEFNDGKVRITLSAGGKLGGETGEGASARIDAGGGKGGGGGGDVLANLGLTGKVGGTWEFPSPDAAEDFVDIVRNRARDTFLDARLPPLGFINHLIGTDEDRPLRAPDIVYGEGGLGGGAKGDVGPANWKVEGSLVLGVRRDNINKQTTVYVQLKESGELGVSALLGVDGKLDLEGQLALTFDEHNKPLKATIIAKGTLDGIAGLSDKIKDPSDLIKKIKINAKGGEGNRVEILGELDLTKDENLRALQDFAANPLTGAVGLGRAVADDGTFSARVYDTHRNKYGPAVKGAEGFSFGFEASYEKIDSDLIGAWKWDKDDGFRTWVTCRPRA